MNKMSHKSATKSEKRIMKELALLGNKIDGIPGCSAGPIGDNVFIWEGVITGPEGTLYENGIFKLSILFPRDYPYKAPNVTFITSIFHCNINDSGQICLDILKDKWSPILTIGKVLLSICSLLGDPNPDDPLSADVAELFMYNRSEHDKIAREWTLKYATNKVTEEETVEEETLEEETVD